MIIFLIILALCILPSCIVIVPQTKSYIIERLGAYKTTWEVGIHFKIPIIDRIARKVSLKEQCFDFAPQPVITKDNVTMQIDTVVFLKIVDPKLYMYGIHNPNVAIENLTATTLRNIIGDLSLDETLTSRDKINGTITTILDEATDAWGIKVNRVEVKNIIPPKDIQEAMEKQMRAERDKRASILKAEGDKQSLILKAEAQKESAILNAQGEKETKILAAQAEKESKILAAEGESESILKVQNAIAEGIKMINNAAPSQASLTLKSLEALEKVADGKSTKLIIPSNLQDIVSLTSVVKETFSNNEEPKVEPKVEFEKEQKLNKKENIKTETETETEDN